MRVQRTKHKSAYVQVPNSIARHSGLSLEAVGLLVRLLSMPDKSSGTVESIAALVPNGRRSVSKAMNDLIAAGYIKRARLQDPETGRWVTISTVTDTPEGSAVSPTDRFPTVGVPTGQAVGGSPIGSKTEEKKDITPPNPKAGAQPEEVAPTAPKSTEQGGEGESSFLGKISREMTREARRILERLSLHKALPLSDSEIGRLAPRMVPWLQDDHRSEDILRCLTANLPQEIGSVPGLITHRLINFVPERSVPAAPLRAPQPSRRAECDVCTTIFPLGHQGGVCRTCKDEMDRAAELIGSAA
ncbi:hypothetical protein ABZ916_25930 [Streptomyces sp. NPDC046853]|uniref:hypothetical protein n=1 Tax=Streptomyces sp. NPDC046853 TaxID=3154920 RepID=UPI0034040DBC